MSGIAKTPQNNKRPYVLRKGIANKSDLDTTPIVITSASVTLDRESYSGRPIVLNRAAGISVILPPASGTGDVYPFYVQTTFTGAAEVKVANANDTMTGTAILFQDAGDTVVGFQTGATADTVDLYEASNTTGGMKGARLTLVDIASNLWHVHYVSDAGGTEATPFTATVS